MAIKIKRRRRPLSADEIEAFIKWRISELRILACETACVYWRSQPSKAEQLFRALKVRRQQR